MLLDRLLNFFTSLRLTVFCLACALVLVFAGTLAQVHLGLYVTQARYFHTLFVFWSPPGTSWKVPVWPGGYLLGGLLLVNLIAAHIKRFTFNRGKIGLFMIHAGLILLFLGQFFTEVFQVESTMRLEEGETKSYSESTRKHELAIVDVSNPDHDQVVSIPEAQLAQKGELHPAGLPFTLRVKEYFPNSAPAPAMESVAGTMQRIKATQGVGQRLFLRPQPVTTAMDEENLPAALLEVETPKGSAGSWMVSTWLTKPFYLQNLRQMLGGQLASLLSTPQQFTYENRTYQLALRPVRYYKPYSITLLEFTHKRYKGTDIPKDFSSRVRVRNPQKGEDREVRIYMNSPLRYAGETYYQASFEPGDKVSILQDVRNPAWVTPYLSCTLIGVGLTLQFLKHLIKFAKRGTQPIPVSVKGARNGKLPAPEDKLEPALVGASAAARTVNPANRPVRRTS